MKERGIIFNAEVVRAIIDGRKTQTRLPADFKVREKGYNLNFSGLKSGFYCNGVPSSGFVLRSMGAGCWDDRTYPLHCPLGKIGDRLWVRETWQGPLVDYENANKFYKAPEPFQTIKNCVYKADGGPHPEYFDADDNLRYGWKSSAQMPRWASRILLEITSVRVERLQEAGDDDFKAEGYPLERELTGGSADAFCWFRHLWDSVSKPEFNYESNPWVWVITFKQIQEG